LLWFSIGLAPQYSIFPTSSWTFDLFGIDLRGHFYVAGAERFCSSWCCTS
jgi:hypothetical protein